MSRKILALALVVIFAFSLAGCVEESGYYSGERSAAAGALGGAAAGAALGSIIGAATGSPATGAWIGAASGALVGGVGSYLYAEHQNNQIHNRRMAASSYNYQPSQGNVVNVDQATANPPTVSPGQQVNLGMQYTVLTPSNTPVSLNLVREVRYRGQLLGQPYQTTVSNANGTFSDTVAYSLPSNASPGSYTVTSRLVSSYGTSQKDAYFTVR
ncbi:MAG: glycine zipper domain-containing protein [Deltaproteobacteria bacterium]|nr:glycine zipper domain-containing protein [Deltaproteobacteria bacterium]